MASALVAAVVVVMVMTAVVAAIVIAMSMIAIVISVPRAVMLVVIIAADVSRFIFFRSNEIHRPIAGIVFPAVLAPIFCVARRHVQVNGRRRRCLRLDQHRLCIDERRGTFIADLNLTVDTRRDFTRQHQVNVQVARRTGTGSRQPHRQD